MNKIYVCSRCGWNKHKTQNEGLCSTCGDVLHVFINEHDLYEKFHVMEKVGPGKPLHPDFVKMMNESKQ